MSVCRVGFGGWLPFGAAVGDQCGDGEHGTRPLRVYADGQDLVLATFSSNPEVIEQHIFRRIR